MAVQLQPIDQLTGQREFENRMERETAVAQQAAGTVISGISGQLQDRWWKKEYEEFQETAAAEFNEAVSVLGRMEGDDAAVDHQGAMETFNTAVKDYIGKASLYKDNPYIGQASKAMFDYVTNITNDILSGERDLRTAQTEQARAGAVERYAAAGLSRARAAQLGGGLGKGPFGLDPVVLEGTQSKYQLNLIKGSKEYARRKGELITGKVRSQWAGLSRTEKIDYDGDIEKYAATVGLTQEEERDFDAAQLREHFAFRHPTLDGSAIDAIVSTALGPNRLNLKENVDGTREVKIPVRLEDEDMDRIILRYGGEEPPPALEDITSLREIEEKYKRSDLHKVSTAYMRLRRVENASHEEAMNVISLSPEQGGSGLLDKLAGEYFDMTGKTSRVTDSNIRSYRDKLIKFMDDQLGGALEEEDYAIRIEEGEVGPLERIGTALESVLGAPFRRVEEALAFTGTHPLAEAGKRTGGRILQPPSEEEQGLTLPKYVAPFTPVMGLMKLGIFGGRKLGAEPKEEETKRVKARTPPED